MGDHMNLCLLQSICSMGSLRLGILFFNMIRGHLLFAHRNTKYTSFVMFKNS